MGLDLKGCRALVTGASSGIGAGLAEALAAQEPLSASVPGAASGWPRWSTGAWSTRPRAGCGWWTWPISTPWTN